MFWLILGDGSAEDIIQVEGSTVILMCKMKLDANNSVIWFRDGVRINASSNRHYVFKRKGRKLVIKGIQQSDSGMFVCKDPSSKLKVKSFRVVATGMNVFYPGKCATGREKCIWY